MKKLNPDSTVHQGHRQRMKEKLRVHGSRIFDTYELLEMLLYYVIPYRDTNPVSKALLARFGSLDGVLRAERGALLEVDGIGERAAEFISVAGGVTSPDMRRASGGLLCDNYERVGSLFVRYFEKNPDSSVAILLLDNSMRMLGIECIPGEKFGSAGVKPRFFIDAAMRHSASVAIIGYTHPHGPLFPMASELVTTELICRELAAVGVEVAEEYIICGSRYVGISHKLSLKLSYENPDLMRFIASCGGTALTELGGGYRLAAPLAVSLGSTVSAAEDYGEYEYGEDPLCPMLSRLFTFVMKSDTEGARRVAELCCQTGFFYTAQGISDEGVSTSIVTLIRILGGIASRRGTDALKPGRVHSDKEIEEYFEALFIAHSAETVYMMLFDDANRVISVEYMGEGTVNHSDLYPRMLIERAVRCRASKAIIAHNHPRGKAEASQMDIYTTDRLGAIFESAGIRLVRHYVVSESGITSIEPGCAR